MSDAADLSRSRQKLIDALQVAVLAANQMAVTAQRQAIDAAQCVGALERVIAELPRPIPINPEGRS